MKKSIITLFLFHIYFFVSAQNFKSDTLNIEQKKWTVNKFKGNIVTKTIHFNDCELFYANQNISIIEIPKKSKYHFDLAYQPKELIGVDSIALIYNAIAGINGTFFDTKNGGSVDYIKSNGEEINKNLIGKSGFRAEHQKGAIIINKKDLSIKQWNGDENWEKNLAGADVMVSGPILRVDGENAILANNDFNLERAPRSAIGIKPDGTILLVAIDGRMIEAEGMTIKEEQQLMKMLGCKDAINLDGGGSTSLFMKNATETGFINHPSDNRVFDHKGQRKVANAIILVK